MKEYIVYTKEKGKIETDNWTDFLGLTRHRLDGPAYQNFFDGQLRYKSYYINGKIYTKQAHTIEIFKMKLSLI